MTTRHENNPMHELRAAQALGEDLTAQELAELEAWFTQNDDARDDNSYELAAAGVVLAMANLDSSVEMPASLREKLVQQARAFESGTLGSTAPVARIEAGGSVAGRPEIVVREVAVWRQRATLAWAAACVALVVGLFGWLRPAPQASTTPTVVAASLERQWEEFATLYPDAKRSAWIDWELNGEGPEIPGVQGEVIWSEAAQTGLMRFDGLPTNDPNQAQYQLWIVDKRGLFDDQGQSARISGGVFDRKPQPGANGSVIVPIQPRLMVQGAAAFAVTIEEPGGVWTSDMSRRVTIAVLGSG